MRGLGAPGRNPGASLLPCRPCGILRPRELWLRAVSVLYHASMSNAKTNPVLQQQPRRSPRAYPRGRVNQGPAAAVVVFRRARLLGSPVESGIRAFPSPPAAVGMVLGQDVVLGSTPCALRLVLRLAQPRWPGSQVAPVVVSPLAGAGGPGGPVPAALPSMERSPARCWGERGAVRPRVFVSPGPLLRLSRSCCFLS